MAEYSFTSITGFEDSILRKEFESLDGKFDWREVDIRKVTDDIVDLYERPEYTPHISISQARRLGGGLKYFFSELFYTSNEFLDEFEKFLRKNSVSVKAKNFDTVPKKHRHLFNTPYSLVPVDIDRTEVSISYPNGNYKSITHDKFKGVDFNSSCTFRMLEPETLYNKLEQIEKRAKYHAKIEKSKGNKEEIVAFESHLSRAHFVFRKTKDL